MGLVFLEIFRLSQSHCKVVWWIRNPNPNLIAEILMTHTTRLVLAKMKTTKQTSVLDFHWLRRILV